MSKKSKLEPEVAPFYRDEVSGVIPPFSAILRVGCMVLGEFIDIARQCPAKSVPFILPIDDGNETCQKHHCHQATPKRSSAL